MNAQILLLPILSVIVKKEASHYDDEENHLKAHHIRKRCTCIPICIRNMYLTFHEAGYSEFSLTAFSISVRPSNTYQGRSL
jgi:hypothetical protein